MRYILTSAVIFLVACGGIDQSQIPDEVTLELVVVIPTPEPTVIPTAEPTITPTAEPTIEPTPISLTVAWDIPETRENGEELLLSEIGGYEVIYAIKSGPDISAVILDPTVTEYEISGEPGRYKAQVAIFDTDNLYSDFSDPVYYK